MQQADIAFSDLLYEILFVKKDTDILLIYTEFHYKYKNSSNKEMNDFRKRIVRSKYT